jgi:SAM-dependent methyltransferase
MKTNITSDNPHGYDRYGFAWQNIGPGGKAHLDFGCDDGQFLSSLASKKTGKLVGVDIDRESVEKARENFEGGEFVHLEETVPLPFADAYFSSITILDVFEHVMEQQALLKELNRVLSEDGKLIITVPGKHFFSFLDVGNFKFVFPQIHRWYYCRKHASEEYERRYVANPDKLVGDISAEKRWHEHFSRRKLGKLLSDAGFAVEKFDGTGFFSRLIIVISIGFSKIWRRQNLIKRIHHWDAKRFASTNLFCLAKKK